MTNVPIGRKVASSGPRGGLACRLGLFRSIPHGPRVADSCNWASSFPLRLDRSTRRAVFRPSIPDRSLSMSVWMRAISSSIRYQPLFNASLWRAYKILIRAKIGSAAAMTAVIAPLVIVPTALLASHLSRRSRFLLADGRLGLRVNLFRNGERIGPWQAIADPQSERHSMSASPVQYQHQST